jgi:UDPglucose 6-dehydrogenase
MPGPMRVSVIGTGYLGATHAACMAACGHDVVGVDADARKVATLGEGRAPFHEPGLQDLLAAGIRDGRLRFSTSLADAADADVHFLCVGTPQSSGNDAADLSALWAVVDGLSPLLGHPCLVVGKSTVPVGTSALVDARVQAAAPAGVSAEVAWNPEFLREGHAVEDSMRPDRLVWGVASDAADALLCEVYQPVLATGVKRVRTDPATAELAKVSANAMLATRISFVNLLAEVCERAGADVGDLTQILGLDHRIGDRFLNPGIGYGGGCLPKDTRAFAARAAELGVDEPASLLRDVDAINMRQRARTIDLADRLVGGCDDATIAVWGAAFKADSDDVRDSPALDIAATLSARGARVRVYDPAAVDNARGIWPDLEYAATPEDACAGADLLLVLTEWAEFRGADPVSIADTIGAATVIDGRLVLDSDKWRAAGWQYHGLGRGAA